MFCFSTNLTFKNTCRNKIKTKFNQYKTYLKNESIKLEDKFEPNCRRKLYETSMIRLTQTRMKIHHASSIRPIKNKLFTDENIHEKRR
jgi:S-adenosylmethionine:diacylglycerol 3-amino-3-carboxypropyl transferase